MWLQGYLPLISRLKVKKKSNPKVGQIFVSKVLISEALLALDLVVVSRQAGHREGDEDPGRG